jgi:hypothetical protein
MFGSSECCVASGRGPCDCPITRPEGSCWLYCVILCNLETLRITRLRSTLSCCATERITNYRKLQLTTIYPTNEISLNFYETKMMAIIFIKAHQRTDTDPFQTNPPFYVEFIFVNTTKLAPYVRLGLKTALVPKEFPIKLWLHLSLHMCTYLAHHYHFPLQYQETSVRYDLITQFPPSWSVPLVQIFSTQSMSVL